MSKNPTLSGSAIAVLCGVGGLFLSIFGGNSFDLWGKIILFLRWISISHGLLWQAVKKCTRFSPDFFALLIIPILYIG